MNRMGIAARRIKKSTLQLKLTTFKIFSLHGNESQCSDHNRFSVAAVLSCRISTIVSVWLYMLTFFF
jgi:hypothetical protein